nr:hypothetical protein [Tanacetum cinerariifolium]
MRTRRSYFPPNRSRKQTSNIVEPEFRTIVEMADNRTMAQMLQAPIEGYENAIVVPPINANNFELKQTLINLVQSNQFTEGEARTWLDKEPPHSILTWEDLVSKFINQFFPPSKTTYLRNEIINFLQKPNETFNEAWERFKDLLRQCPHHGFSELHQLDMFYNALNPNDQDALDSAAGGNFLDKIPRECLSIIESKSKVRYSRSRVTDLSANTNAPPPSSSPFNSLELQQIVTSLKDKLDICMIRFEKSFNDMKAFITPTAPIKAVEEMCQFQTAAVGNFMQGNRHQNLSSQIRPSGFNQPNHLPQPQFENYLCNLYGNNSHDGYDCQQQFPFVYEQEPSYNQNYNDNYYPHDSPSFLCCDKCGDLMKLSSVNLWTKMLIFLGSDQIQTPQYPHVHPPSQEINDKQAQPEDSNELFQKLLKDLKELAEYDNSPSRDHSNDNHSVQNEESLENSSNEIASSNSNQEMEGSSQDSNIRQLIREECSIEEQEVKNVIEQPAEQKTRIEKSLQNFRVIHKSSISLNNTSQVSLVHAIAPILSNKEPEYSPKDKRECDVPICENSPICDNHYDIFSDSNNDDDISSDEESFKDIEYVDASLPKLEIVSVEEENVGHQEEKEFDLEEIQDIVLREKLLSINCLIAKFFRFDKNIDELNEDERFDPGGKIDIPTNDKDDDYFPFIFVIRSFLPCLIYPEVSPLFLSAESEDTIFNPGFTPQ